MKNIHKIILVLIVAIGIAIYLKPIEGFFEAQEPPAGTVEVSVSYFYNNYHGFKPDVDAKVLLVEKSNWHNFQDYSYYDVKFPNAMGFFSKSDKKRIEYNYEAIANVHGIVKIDNVLYGKYEIIVVSEGRKSYSHKTIDLNAEKIELVKNFKVETDWLKKESW